MAEELTNQSTSETSDDFALEEVNESTEEENSNDTPESFLDIKYNGENKSLTREEAVTLAQKGMNYDKIAGRLNELQNSPVMQSLNNLASRAGMTVEEYTDRLQEFQQQAAINDIATDYKARYPDATDDMANEYAEQAYNNQLYQQQANEARKSQAEREAENNRYIQEVMKFQERYPDVKVEDLDNSVIDDINAGTPLETAYDRFLIRQLQARVTNNEVNDKNKANATGKLSANHAGADGDPFVQGLLG